MHEFPVVNFSNGTMPYLAWSLMEQPTFNTGEWQSTDISQVAQYATHELENVTVFLDVPRSVEAWADTLGSDVNYAWAEEHFQERVGGVPLNPPPSHARWPWHRHNVNHQNGTKFSHTYPERMWPKHVGNEQCSSPDECNDVSCDRYHSGNRGIRFHYGDLNDVVELLIRSPYTRQAYLPIWFPEDTGAHHRQRVPCTLGYHFMIRDGKLSCRYYMRSCDLVRHFADDIYLAGRLMQWVCEQVNVANADESDSPIRHDVQVIQPGQLAMYIASLHAFAGDRHTLRRIAERHVTVND